MPIKVVQESVPKAASEIHGAVHLNIGGVAVTREYASRAASSASKI
jgi:hypothetical protein